MAASMRGVTLLTRRSYLFKFKASPLHTAAVFQRSTLPSTYQTEEVVYPPIKPKYPPGQWGKISPANAWKIHDKAQELIQVPNVKMRLEKIAGPFDGKKPFLYDMKLIDRLPGTLSYKQYVSKTHVVEGLPDIYNTIDKMTLDTCVKRLEPLFEDAILHEVNQYYHILEQNKIHLPERLYFGHRLLGRLLSIAQSFMASTVPHLHRAQIDERVRVETFWKRCGYEEDFAVYGSEFQDILNFQLKFVAGHQIRTELPLPEILPVEDELCQSGYVPEYRYSPRSVGQNYFRERPITVSGHWVGDPCEFHQLSVIVPHLTYDEYIKNHGDRYLDEDSVGWGITAGFGSTVSQSFNQGFFPWVDITYPFVSQVLITDGQWFRFFTYQLNTTQIWKDEDANPTRNIMWASPRMKLYDTVEDGKVKGLDTDVYKHLIQCLMLEPQDRGVDLRPYLPNEAAPVLTKKLLNHVGEELIPQHKIGRLEYPKNAVYF